MMGSKRRLTTMIDDLRAIKDADWGELGMACKRSSSCFAPSPDDFAGAETPRKQTYRRATRD